MAILYNIESNMNCDEKIEIFNQQKQKLSAIFKRHMEIHESGSGDYLPVIKELIVYMSRTFHEENMVMMHTHYPNFLEHAKAHQRFTQKIEEFLRSYKQGDSDLGFKMFVFLKDWIHEHSSKLDMECAEYLRKKAIRIKEVTGEDTPLENSLLTYYLNK